MKKRVRNKNHRLLIKKKNSKWIILSNDYFLLSALLLVVVIIGLSVVSNQLTPKFSGQGELAAVAPVTIGPTSEDFNQAMAKFFDAIKPWFVPEGMDGILGLIIGIISLAIIFSIMFDLLTLVSPLSSWVNIIIGIGFGIVMIAFKWNIWFAGWVVTIGAIIFGWAGTAALALTIVMSILAIWFIFFGGLWIQRWLIGVRARRRGLEITKTAMNSATDIKGLRTLANQAMRRP